MKRVFMLLFIPIFFLSTKVYSQNTSNEGTDFWAVFPTHIPSGEGLAQIAIFVTSKTNSTATVSCGSFTDTKPIPANSAVQFNVPRINAYINVGEANSLTPLVSRGIRIKVPDGSPKVSAYAHIYGNARSAASLILPYETLGQTYYSMNYTQVDFGPQFGNNFLVLAAADDNMDLIINESNGTAKSIHFDKAGDVYEYMSGQTDFTGISVNTDPVTSSCKKFAAFSGNSMIRMENCGASGNSSYDPLYQQLYPTVSWGKNYGVVPFKNRTYILRIIAQEDNTTVKFNGETFILKKGEYKESATLSEPTFVTSDKLISVAQFSLSQKCTSAIGGSLVGDPDMVILNPIEFNIKAVTVFSSTLQNISERYINVLMATNRTSTFKVDGVAPASPWIPLLNNPMYSYNQIPVLGLSGTATFKSLTLTADEGFNATAYGFGQAESYAYSAGTNLASNNYLTVVTESSKEESSNGCINLPSEYKINLPYIPTKITWVLDDGEPIVRDNQVYETKVNNGQTSYVFTYPDKLIFNKTGTHKLVITAFVPQNASACQTGNLITNYVFNIYDLPTADFDIASVSCAKSDITFTDKSKSNTIDFGITKWLWDFGDGSVSEDQHPKHQYEKEGKYTVKLSVKSEAGCYADPIATKEITIYPLPKSNFSAGKACLGKDFLITDNSTISSGITVNKIVNWNWDFGDGTTPVDKTDAIPFNYKYTALGTYTIKLKTTSNNGCISEVFSQQIVVTDLPVANFTMPDVCLFDEFALFTNTSNNVDGSQNNLIYEWNFGEPGSVNNISTDKDAKHKYTNFGDYTVTLKITNSNGCSDTKTQIFTVNGGQPIADFELLPGNNLCSNTDVIISNKSTVNFGKVTKIEVYKDVVNEPANFETFSFPKTGDPISLKYTSFGGNSQKSITIRLKAYSGGSCFSTKDLTIELKPSPQLEFSNIPDVCENDGSILINQAKETSGILGNFTAEYSGKGINASGNFNPKLVELEVPIIITYTFSTENGCKESITKTIVVHKNPVVDAGPTIYILAGGEIKIPAVAEGTNLTYLWSPSAGLSNSTILNPVASPEKDTDYQLLVTSDQGCTASTHVMVKVLQSLSPPNTFTPNGDNINDAWDIKYLDSYPNATVEVFNRNGGRVFFSNGYKIPFDGTYQNEPLPVGVYYYIINPRNGRKTINGPLTIIR